MRSRSPLLLVASALLVGVPALSPAVPSSAVPGPGEPSAGAGCAEPLFGTEVRAASARSATPARFAEALARHGDVAADVAAAARTDPALWLDRCGRALYRDPVPADLPDSRPAARGAGPAVPAGTDVLALSSRPGAARTIHLEFTGRDVARSAWHDGPFTAPAFSADADPTTLSAAERSEVYATWLTVAEDFAPFDVDVTTADPGADAITRTDASDQRYGVRIVVSDAPEVAGGCGCGGVAYVGVFDTTHRHADHQLGWVFPGALGDDGWAVGEAASHEAGHTLGLGHDGRGTSAYHGGAKDWAPIMGASYGAALGQWSRGEYAGATNREDDLAVMAANGAPPVADDHAGPGASATPIVPGTPRTGVVGTRADTDAFSFTGAGATTVRVTPVAAAANLDVGLQVLAADGTVVGTADPAAPSGSSPAQPSPAWLAATWTGTLPAGGGPFTAVVDGVGAGDATLTQGGYSDYASLGRYTVQVATSVPPEPEPEPLTLAFLTGAALPAARLGRAYRAVVRLAGPADRTVRPTGGALPRGVRLTTATDRVRLTGSPRRTGRFRVTLAAASGDGQTATRTFVLRVRR